MATCVLFFPQSPAGLGADGMVVIPTGQSLSLRFGKGLDKRSSRIDRGSSASGVGPSIGIEVRLTFLKSRKLPISFCQLKVNKARLRYHSNVGIPKGQWQLSVNQFSAEYRDFWQ